LIWVVAAGSLLAACGQLEKSNQHGGVAAEDEVALRSAITAVPGLGHPEYDLDTQVAFFVFGKGSIADINDKMGEGYRLLSVSAYTPFLFSAALVRNDGDYHREGNGWSNQLTESELMDIVNNDPARRIVDIAPYQFLGQRYYAAVWLDNGPSQHIDYKVALHATPDAFKAAMTASPGYRVIDVEAQPVQTCGFLSCSGDATNIEVSGVGILNAAPNNHTQLFGYGPGAGNGTTTLPAASSTILNASLGATIASINGRMADFDSPFGDGNYFWVVENSNDADAAPTTNANCADHADVSTERNWWLANLVFSDDNNQEDAVVANSRRLGARPGKIKPYQSDAFGSTDRWLVTYYDNEVPPVNGVGASGSDVLQKVDEVVQNRMKRWGLPAVTLGIVKDGNLIYSKGYGYSDLGNLRPTQPTDLFRLASMSKPIAQSLILRLIDEGKLSLGTKPFGTIFGYNSPGTPLACPRTVTGTCQFDVLGSTADATGCTLADIRVSDLLWHGSGVRNRDDSKTDNDAFAFDDDIGQATTPQRWIQNECDSQAAGQAPFFRPPGNRTHYMNSEFQILAKLVEQVTGKPYQDYLAEVLGLFPIDRIRPAHLRSQPDVDGRLQSIPYALPLPYLWNGVIPSPPVADSVVCADPADPMCLNHLFVGSGSMAASSIDLLRWATAVDGSRGGASIIAKPTFDANFRMFLFDAPGKPFSHGGYFPGDTQAWLDMTDPRITFFFATNSEALWAGSEVCCPGTPPAVCGPSVTCGVDSLGNPIQPVPAKRFTHATPNATSVSAFNPQDSWFLFELRSDLYALFGSSSCTLPTDDHFGDFLPNEPHARCHDFSTSAGPSCTANVAVSDIDAGSTGGTSMTLAPTGPFGPGPHDVKLLVSNGSSVSSCDAKVIVQDNTAPTVTAPPNITVTTCDGSPIALGAATASDNCVVSPSIQTTIVAANGTAITPIPVTGGTVTLGPGSYTVQYVAVTGTLSSAPATQTVTVRAAVQTSQSFALDDRAVLRQPSGAAAALFNSGTGTTSLGYDAKSGSIVSKPAVTALDRAVITGNIVSAGSISAPHATVTGSQTPFATLPPMSGLPSLPAFPTPTLTDASVNSGTLTIAPGSRTNGTVNGGTLVLQAGTYYFRNLTINNGGTVRAPTGTTVYVRDSLAFRSSIRQPTGTAVQTVTLGYAGTAATSLEATFNGTFVAPNATAMLGVGSGLTFTGAFYAKGLEVRPASTLVCQTSAALPPS